MNIVFCADRQVLAGLHVAAFSVLKRIGRSVSCTRISIFSDSLTISDLDLLRKTLDGTGKPYQLEFRQIVPENYAGFPPLNGSRSAYYRLQAAQEMEVERFLYLDVDTLCQMDVSTLADLDMGAFPTACVPEAPMDMTVDRTVGTALGNSPDDYYFNSGILLVNVVEWRQQEITRKAMEYIALSYPKYHDQSALNVVLHRNYFPLGSEYNCMSNMRKNWPSLVRSADKVGKIIHFIDYPKPWDLLAEWIHPNSRLWRAELEQTAMKDFRSWHTAPTRKFPRTRKMWAGYKRVLKDRLLFAGYERQWLTNIKGIPAATPQSSR